MISDVSLLRLLFEEHGNRKAEAVKNIKDDRWTHSPEEFLASLSKSRRPEYLTQYSLGELAAMDLYKLEGFDIGFAISSDGDIVAVHNNEPDVKGIGDELIQAAIRKGGYKLDHFDGPLSDYYERNGFIEYHREPYDPSISGGKMLPGNPDVIFRKLTTSL